MKPNHKVYVIAEVDVTNTDAYAKEYGAKVQPLIEKLGGRFVAIGDREAISGGKVTPIEGNAPKPKTLVVIELWDSLDKVQAWRANPEFKQLHEKVGLKYASFRTFAVDGAPAN